MKLSDIKPMSVDELLRKMIEACGVASAYLYRAQAVPVWRSADGRVFKNLRAFFVNADRVGRAP
jgi:hypothetical protein